MILQMNKYDMIYSETRKEKKRLLLREYGRQIIEENIRVQRSDRTGRRFPWKEKEANTEETGE